MEEMIKNPYALFAENQETYEEAVKKSTDESQSFQRTKHFRMDSAGTYTVRILPLAPAEQPDGSYKLERKGYEYPVKTQETVEKRTFQKCFQCVMLKYININD